MLRCCGLRCCDVVCLCCGSLRFVWCVVVWLWVGVMFACVRGVLFAFVLCACVVLWCSAWKVLCWYVMLGDAVYAMLCCDAVWCVCGSVVLCVCDRFMFCVPVCDVRCCVMLCGVVLYVVRVMDLC